MREIALTLLCVISAHRVPSSGNPKNMSKLRPFVCAFRGRRDGYQLPLALYEAERLGCLVTDYYSGGVGGRILAKGMPHAEQRYVEGLPGSVVKSLPLQCLKERLTRFRQGCRASRAEVFQWAAFDHVYALKAAELAQRNAWDLFLYEPYALPAFRRHYRHDPLKCLFAYDPHHHYLSHWMQTQDVWKGVDERWLNACVPSTWDVSVNSEDEPYTYADRMFCASSFVRKTYEALSDTRPQVIPYGVNMPQTGFAYRAQEGFTVLFVGSASQRKGLAHLLTAWQCAQLPQGSRLILVCRSYGEVLRQEVARVRGVVLLEGVHAEVLSNLYREADLFAMPSLAEGYGQVYMEAMAHGCPVLGTSHSVLPDVQDAGEGVLIAQPGSLDDLVEKLQWAAHHLRGNVALRKHLSSYVSKYCWEGFRKGLRSALLL